MSIFTFGEDKVIQAAGFDPAALHALANKLYSLAEELTEEEWSLIKRALKHFAGK